MPPHSSPTAVYSAKTSFFGADPADLVEIIPGRLYYAALPTPPPVNANKGNPPIHYFCTDKSLVFVVVILLAFFVLRDD